MEFAEMESLLSHLEALIEELQERLDVLDNVVDAEMESLQLQIDNLRN
ncbi:MAG: hypothetical protein K2L24_03735 [Opitutales bacterium]|nr:hypothetical protein [Opitutales bacterium]